MNALIITKIMIKTKSVYLAVESGKEDFDASRPNIS